MGSIILKGVTRSYGDFKAVDNISLDIDDGEFVVLVGPSGCGKSTTLRMIAGLERPTSGQIIIDGRDVTSLPPKERDVAMVFQSYALYPHMTVYDNIAFPLKMGFKKKDGKKVRFTRQEIDEKVEKAAKILDISDQLDKKPKQLSGGQRQRVALGRALVRDPQVFLMDEPLSNLDAKLRTKMRLELKRLHKELGTTMVYVTHDQLEAMTLADRIAVLKKGVLQQYDTPLNEYNIPANRFVATFIGNPAMNIIDGKLKAHPQGYDFIMGKVSFGLDLKTARRVYDAHLKEAHVIYGIRPEDVRVSRQNCKNCIQFEVYGTELLGNVTYLHLRNDDTMITVQADAEMELKIGDSVYVNLASPNAHIFGQDGNRV